MLLCVPKKVWSTVCLELQCLVACMRQVLLHQVTRVYTTWWQSANRATVKMPRFGGYKVRVWSACLVVQAIIKMQ